MKLDKEDQEKLERLEYLLKNTPYRASIADSNPHAAAYNLLNRRGFCDLAEIDYNTASFSDYILLRIAICNVNSNNTKPIKKVS